MAIVAGIDFGTASVRVSLVDSERGALATASSEYPVLRDPDVPDHATQRHSDHLRALENAMADSLAKGGISGNDIAALAIDTTGSTVAPLGEDLQPIDDFYLWCDHRSKREAAEITATAQAADLEAIDWCGGTYSSEWGFAKVLHWLRHNPDRREEMASAADHCDVIAATLCGITTPDAFPRSVCAMGHKWMWNSTLGGLPSEEFLTSVDPLLAGVRDQLAGRYETSGSIAGGLSAEWAGRLGLRAGIPVPVGGIDAHWDAIGAGIREGDIVNVIGTSTCIMAITGDAGLIPGLCGIVEGSIHPDYFGIEAGLSASGDVFDAIARRAGKTAAELSGATQDYRLGQTGLLRVPWDNGDRTVLVNPHLSGITLGWTLASTAADEFFAAIEGTALHTGIILDRMAEHGVPVERVINGGGIPQKNPRLNEVYATLLGKPVLVPEKDITGLGAAIFAFLAAGAFASIEEAQDALCPSYRIVEPEAADQQVAKELTARFREVYFEFGRETNATLPTLRQLAGGGSA